MIKCRFVYVEFRVIDRLFVENSWFHTEWRLVAEHPEHTLVYKDPQILQGLPTKDETVKTKLKLLKI